MVEQPAVNRRVVGSSPTFGAIFSFLENVPTSSDIVLSSFGETRARNYSVNVFDSSGEGELPAEVISILRTMRRSSKPKLPRK